MELDYSAGCVNFRDVGEFVNWLAGEKLLPENKLFRGGKTDSVDSPAEIGNPKTIINLRQGHDLNDFGVACYHFPLENKVEKYHTGQKQVRNWLNRIVQLFERDDLQYPVLVHCLSGKDRTGIVIAALLLVLNVKPEIIIKEYMLSQGDVSETLIQTAITGIAGRADYFHKVNLDKVRVNLLKGE
jgi:protein-tyrosine phosphatase